MFTQVLQRQPVHKAASFAALCTAARRWQSKRACVNMLIFFILKSSEPHYLSLNAAAYFYVLLRTELRFAHFIRLCRSSVSVCPEYKMPDP